VTESITPTTGTPALTDETRPPDAPVTFASFLIMECHPSTSKSVADLWYMHRSYSGGSYPALNTPIIRLHCRNENCNGMRNFRCQKEEIHLYAKQDQLDETWINYICSDCQSEMKYYSLLIARKELPLGVVTKFGEFPPYGPPVPDRLLRLFGGDSHLFLKGRSCENQALGVGAFAYYRRVVESHKNQLFDEIIKVCKLIGASQEFIAQLEESKTLISFSESVDHIEIALPDALLIDGHNPLSLLHRALSAGLHNETDDECLGLAHSIRVVLAELVERLTQLKKDDRELANAVKRLLKPKS
jgi:hypothetical protein